MSNGAPDTKENSTEGGPSLRERTATGLSWRFATVVAQVVLQAAVGIVLARLLPPADFGLVGLALVVVNFGRIVSDLGLAESIVQQDELTSRHVRVGFTVSVLLGLSVTAAVYAFAPLVADFFRDPRVTDLLRFIGVSFFLTGFGIVSEALLRRRLRFKHLMVVEVVSYGLGYGVVGITLALSGFGEWSLAWAQIAQSLVNSVAAYLIVHHPVRPLAALPEFRDLAGFGAGSSLFRIFNYFAREGDYFLVGRLMGPGPLGLYTRAYQIMKLPLSYTGQVLSSVLFPAVSRVQHDNQRVRSAYRQAISMTTLVALPCMVMMVILAPEVVIGLFGPQWTGTIAPLQVLAAFGLFRATYHICGAFVKAKGAVYRLFGLQVIYASSVLGGTWWATTQGGLEAVALAVGLSIFLMYLMVSSLANSLTETRAVEFARWHLPSLLFALPTGACCLVFRALFKALGLPDLLVFVPTVLLSVAGAFVSLHAMPAALSTPVTRVLHEVLDQDVLSDRVGGVLRRIVPGLPGSTAAGPEPQATETRPDHEPTNGKNTTRAGEDIQEKPPASP